jgi:predicted metal-binding membrane protein
MSDLRSVERRGDSPDRSSIFDCVVRLAVSPWPLVLAVVVLAWLLLAGHEHDHSATFSRTLAMWATMSVAMMLPTAVPMLATARSVMANHRLSHWWLFLAAYVVVWWGFSVAASVLQVWLVDTGLVGHGTALFDLDGSARWTTSITFALAGAYQFSTLKARCLHACSNPMNFLLRHWSDGAAGATRMGLHHGLTCVGCCWALMLLALVGGAATLVLMLVGTVLMAVEKVPALDGRVAKPLGVVLVTVSLAVLVA